MPAAVTAPKFLVTARVTIEATVRKGEYVCTVGGVMALEASDVRAEVVELSRRTHAGKFMTQIMIHRCEGRDYAGKPIQGAMVSILARDTDGTVKLVAGRAVTGFESFDAALSAL